MGAAFCAIGCTQRTPVRQFTVESAGEVESSESLRSSFGTLPFKWSKVSEDWEVADNDQFSVVAWNVVSDQGEGRITLSNVSMQMKISDQVTRWRGQIGNTDTGGTTPMILQGGAATWVDISGDKEGILGMMIPRRSTLWVFKFRGSNDVIDEQRKQFKAFCESVEVL